MPYLFCFIDDAQFELDNFRQWAAPAFEGVEFIYASSFERAEDKLAGRQPWCYLLDLYGADPAVSPRLPDQPELAGRLADELSPAELFEGAAAQGEGSNLFLRRLFGLVRKKQQAFQYAAGLLGQNRAYGLKNLALARRLHPLATALAYSRKAMYQDAAAFLAAGGDGALQKPQGADDQAIAQATRQEAPALAEVCRKAVTTRLAALSVLGDAEQKKATAKALEQWLRATP